MHCFKSKHAPAGTREDNPHPVFFHFNENYLSSIQPTTESDTRWCTNLFFELNMWFFYPSSACRVVIHAILTKLAMSRIPSSTGCVQSMVNFKLSFFFFWDFVFFLAIVLLAVLAAGLALVSAFFNKYIWLHFNLNS